MVKGGLFIEANGAYSTTTTTTTPDVLPSHPGMKCKAYGQGWAENQLVEKKGFNTARACMDEARSVYSSGLKTNWLKKRVLTQQEHAWTRHRVFIPVGHLCSHSANLLLAPFVESTQIVACRTKLGSKIIVICSS